MVRRLVASLEEALDVFDAQHQELEVVKRRSDATAEYIKQKMADRLAGEPPDPSLQRVTARIAAPQEGSASLRLFELQCMTALAISPAGHRSSS